MTSRASFSLMVSAAVVVAAVGVAGQGCGCGGGAGSRCNDNQDCAPGLFCSPASLTCEPIATDAGPGATDSGDLPGVDSAIAPTDSGPAPTDSGTPCHDDDGDGFTTCAGDCDDSDPLTYPGAPEVCGDGVDNSCAGGTGDPVSCMGLGTYVSETTGNNANPGTQALPVQTIAQGVLNALAIGGGVDVYVALGTYAEAVTLIDGISILGGYEPVTWANDPATYVAIIDDITPAGVLAPSGVGATTELSGFTVNGQAGGMSAIQIDNGAMPVVRGNIVNGPSGTTESYGIYINPGAVPNAAAPLVESNVVNSGLVGAGWPNRAAGIFIEATAALIVGNEVWLADNDATNWGILSWSGVSGLLIQRNRVRSMPGALHEYAAGIELGGAGPVVDGNDVVLGVCTGNCTGIILSMQGLVTVTNNVSFGGEGDPSAGLMIVYEGDGFFTPDVLVHSNYFDGGGAPGGGLESMGVRLVNYHPTLLRIAGRLIDNIIVSGQADTRYCVWENGTLIDPERLEANDYYLVPSLGATTVLYWDEGSTALALAAANALPEALGLASLSADPLVVSGLPGGDVHLTAGSPCIDTGSTTEVTSAPLDFDGDPRPTGAAPDIGPDEV